MEFRQLQYFVTLTEELHFGRAAAHEHIVQSALSQQLQRLERELGVRLLDRTTHHVRMTAAGDAFLREARQILAHADRAAVAAQRAAGSAATLRVGIVDASYDSMPQILRDVRGARRIPDYGLAVDRRWRVDFAAGLVVGFVAVSIPFLFALALGWVEIGAVFDAGQLALLPGFVAVGAGLLCVGVWEELAMRGVFLGNTADGLRRWLSPHRAIAVAVALSGLVFGLAHIAQPDYKPLILTWVLAGLVFGGMYVFSGSLALPIGAHITVNVAYQMVFVRTDYAGTESYSAVMRIVPDPALAFLQAGGVIDIGVYATLGLLTYLWLRLSRGKITIDPVALQLAASEPRATRRTDDAVHRSRQ